VISQIWEAAENDDTRIGSVSIVAC